MLEILLDFWGGCLQMMTPYNLLIILLGSLVGTVVGALPGLGPSAGLALMIPMTFTMNPTAGLALLMGVYMGTMFGGRITSILINTPGDAPAIVTCMDGYPLMCQGRGGFALGISAISSFMGGFFGIAVLIFMAPTIADLVISFGAPEYFMLLLLGLCTIALLAGDSVMKAMLMTVIGFIIGLVGCDFVSGYTRFCYAPELLEGIDFVVVIMGMYGIGEVLHNVEHNVHLELGKPNFKLREYFPNRKELKEVSLPMLRGSLIGTVIGILPAAGGTIATFLAYAGEKKLAKDPDRFGKGAPEGLAAPEAANNASVGGALVPLITMGIPGSGGTAILLGVFIMFGMRPGPLLMVESGDIVWAMIAGLFIANIFLLISNLLMIPVFVNAIRIVEKHLSVLVLALCCVGAYALNYSFFNVWLMLIFGLFGYVTKKFKLPTGPLILSVVLASSLESYFRQSLMLSKGSYMIFVTRPVSLVILLIILGTAVFSVVNNQIKKKKKAAEKAAK
ncbi:MAG: tripartite tricarboxylate transporter permease [Oscillibacter sp.]|nr:tripartite tricarboxylate transporter permease [Oscillibacter sp.]